MTRKKNIVKRKNKSQKRINIKKNESQKEWK